MNHNHDYLDFLKAKRMFVGDAGFDVAPQDLNKAAFPFQSAVTVWTLRKGRAAIFADCGLGKTLMQIEWAYHVHKKTGGDILILAPLAVAAQTQREGLKFGISINIAHNQASINPGINITNYEKLHKFNSDSFAGIVLDESSILKSFTGKIRNQIINDFQRTPYRLACTATPAPNDFVEIGNHAEFLGVMTRVEMLSLFFINDTGDTGNWRLKGHAEKDFWKWMASWCVMFSKPSDIGFNDDGFILPELIIQENILEYGKPLYGNLFVEQAKTMMERKRARKETIELRCLEAAKVANENDETVLVWCGLNDESAILTKMIDGAVEIKGANTPEEKTQRMSDFSQGAIRALVTKPKIAGFGMNWQHCSKMIFVGLSDSYEAFYQAVRRCWRFGQKKPVTVVIISTDIEGAVLENIKRKETAHKRMICEMVKSMADITKKELNHASVNIETYATDKQAAENWTLYHGDCVEMIKNISDNSIDYSIFSPPFASLFTYSNSIRDMGNCKNKDDFIFHFQFMLKDLLRVMVPGHLVSIHCMDLLATLTHDGYMGIKDFSGDIVWMLEKAGFVYHSRVTIWKDPLIQSLRTKVLCLAHKQISKDSTRCAQGLPDYILTFMKPGDNPRPVSKGVGFDRYIGDDPSPNDALKTNNPRTNKYSHEVWQRYASPVWFDINQTNTLNAKIAREQKDEKHVCPLQLGTIARCLDLWTNPGNVVFSPFAGIGSEGYQALKMGRKFIGIELKKSYFDASVKNLTGADKNSSDQRQFDFLNTETK